MANPNTHTPPTREGRQVVALLEQALQAALENLPDVAGDESFGKQAVAETCKDIAALSHLLSLSDGLPNIVAYM